MLSRLYVLVMSVFLMTSCERMVYFEFLGDPLVSDLQYIQVHFANNSVGFVYDVEPVPIGVDCDTDKVNYVHSYIPTEYTQLVLRCKGDSHGQANRANKLSIAKLGIADWKPDKCVMLHEIGHLLNLSHPQAYNGYEWVYDTDAVTVMNPLYADFCHFMQSEWLSIKGLG